MREISNLRSFSSSVVAVGGAQYCLVGVCGYCRYCDTKSTVCFSLMNRTLGMEVFIEIFEVVVLLQILLFKVSFAIVPVLLNLWGKKLNITNCASNVEPFPC